MGRAGKIQVQVEHKRWGKRQRPSHRRKHENETKIIGTTTKFSCKCLSATRQHVTFTYVSSMSDEIIFITAPCDYGLLDKLLHDRKTKFRKIVLSETVSRVSGNNEKRGYCLCRRQCLSQVVACSNPHCKIEQLNYTCV